VQSTLCGSLILDVVAGADGVDDVPFYLSIDGLSTGQRGRRLVLPCGKPVTSSDLGLAGAAALEKLHL